MSPARLLSAAAYARRVERCWAEKVDRAVVLSPRDWAAISRWYERGVPLALVEEFMAEALERGRGRPAPPRLARLAPAIEEAWSVVLDGRRAEPQPITAGRSADTDAASAWRGVSARQPAASALRELLERLLGRLDDDADPRELDRELDAALASVAPGAMRREIEAELDRELAPFSERMTAERLAATRLRAAVQRLRRRIGLPRLV